MDIFSYPTKHDKTPFPKILQNGLGGHKEEKMRDQAESGFLRSLEEIEREFDRRGVSKADWAREHGIRPGVVYEIFSRRSSCKRGEAHRAAVLLGLKEGVIEERVSA